MASTEAARFAVVQPGDGARADLGVVGVSFKLRGRETGGALALVEHPFPPGALVPPHAHSREDEYSIVTEGQIGFRSGDHEVVLGPGGYVAKPRGEVHTMWNAGPAPARMIEIISPAGLEDHFRELADLIAADHPDLPGIMTSAARYGLTYARPDWLPDLIARYGLIPPPGP